MPSIATLFTPLALLLLATAAPAGTDSRRSRSGKRACSRAEPNQLIAHPEDIVSSVDGIGSSVIAEVSSALSANPVPSLSLAPVNEGFGLSICIGAGMNCNNPPSTTAATPPTTSAVVPTSAPPPSSAPPPMSSTPPPPSSAPPASSAAPTTSSASTSPPTGGSAPSGDKMVFAHFMIGIVSTYKQSDYITDMNLAKSKGIDGFALNIGVDPYTQQQLDYAYAAAEQVGFLCFISFDFNWYSTGDTAGVANMLKRYTDLPATYKVDGKPFVSSFIGDGFDWGACATLVGQPLYAVPFFQPTAALATDAGLAGSFSWAAWPGQLNNVPVDQNLTTERDDLYLSILQPAGKTYMAPVSPWFNTHYGPEVSYSKNWLFYSEELWKYRWDQILELGQKGVNLVEIVTWNDYGESHNVGPYNTPHTDDGASKWSSGLDHTALLDLSVPYIQAFKAGISAPVVTQEFAVYWHRPTLKDVSCDSTDNCGSKPTGWEFVADSVFVATVTKNGAQVTVNSGNNPAFNQQVAGGIQVFQVPMAAGEQSFSITTSAGAKMQGASNVTVLDTCWNGIYNFNFHAGTLLS